MIHNETRKRLLPHKHLFLCSFNPQNCTSSSSRPLKSELKARERNCSKTCKDDNKRDSRLRMGSNTGFFYLTAKISRDDQRSKPYPSTTFTSIALFFRRKLRIVNGNLRGNHFPVCEEDQSHESCCSIYCCR